MIAGLHLRAFRQNTAHDWRILPVQLASIMLARFSSPSRLAIAVCTLASLAACNTEPEAAFTSGGYRYEFQEDAAGEVVRPGEVAKIYITALKGDSVLGSSRDVSPEPQPFIVPAADEPNRSSNIYAEAVDLMSVGDSLSIYLSIDSLDQLPPGFAPGDEVRYDIVLAEVVDSAAFAAEQQAAAEAQRARQAAVQAREGAVADSTAAALAEYRAGGEAFTTTSSGLQYKILEAGDGDMAEPGEPVRVQYYGVRIADGEMFDNSFTRGDAIGFPLGQGAVIPGWDEGIGLLREGARAVLAIPSELAYGENPRPGGPIQPGDDLLFYVELVGVGGA